MISRMTKIKNILLTGDDGYNSPGIRLVIAALRDKYNLNVCATFDQQSGVGGMISMANGFEWGSAEVDGIPALWSKGTPCDSMELAYAYLDQTFDLIISGINWGANLGSAVSGSGTFNAALRGLGLDLAPTALVLSWDMPVEYYLQHNKKEKLDDYLEYPGKAVDEVLDLAFEQQFWGAKLININFPALPTKQAMMAGANRLITEIYDHSERKTGGSKDGKFEYLGGRINPVGKTKLETDLQVVASGRISITPCKLDYIDQKAFKKFEKKQYQLSSLQ